MTDKVLSASPVDVSLGQFGTSFQETTMLALLTDKPFAEQLQDIFKPEYFELEALRFLADRYFAYGKKYRVLPSTELLLSIVKDDLRAGADVHLKTQVVDFLLKLRT